MEVWQMAFNLSQEIFEISATLSKKEDYAMTSQIRRSANSVSENAAEAFGRKTKKDKIIYI